MSFIVSHVVTPKQIIAAGAGGLAVTLPAGTEAVRITCGFPVNILPSGDQAVIPRTGSVNTSVGALSTAASYMPGSFILHRSCTTLTLTLPTGYGAGGQAEMGVFVAAEGGGIGTNNERIGQCVIEAGIALTSSDNLSLDINQLPSHCYQFALTWASGTAGAQFDGRTSAQLKIGTIRPRDVWVKSFYAYRRDDATGFSPRGSVNIMGIFYSDSFSGVFRERLFFGCNNGGAPAAAGAAAAGGGSGAYFPVDNLHIPMDALFTAVLAPDPQVGSVPLLIWDFEGSNELVSTTVIFGMNVHYRM